VLRDVPRGCRQSRRGTASGMRGPRELGTCGGRRRHWPATGRYRLVDVPDSPSRSSFRILVLGGNPKTLCQRPNLLVIQNGGLALPENRVRNFFLEIRLHRASKGKCPAAQLDDFFRIELIIAHPVLFPPKFDNDSHDMVGRIEFAAAHRRCRARTEQAPRSARVWPIRQSRQDDIGSRFPRNPASQQIQSNAIRLFADRA
jgi:hypothetical protein